MGTIRDRARANTNLGGRRSLFGRWLEQQRPKLRDEFHEALDDPECSARAIHAEARRLGFEHSAASIENYRRDRANKP